MQATLAFLDGLARLGPQALTIVDVPATARVLADAFGVPSRILKSADSGAAPVLPPIPAGPPLPDEDGGGEGGGGLAALASLLGAGTPPALPAGAA